jgi:hypothetical protein
MCIFFKPDYFVDYRSQILYYGNINRAGALLLRGNRTANRLPA